MGGDDFNKTDESDGVLPFAPVAKKQTQMNAEHASWLQETHIIESNIEMFESVSKSITKAASQGLKQVILYFTRRYKFYHRIEELVQVLGKNGFNTNYGYHDYGIRTLEQAADNTFGELAPVNHYQKIRSCQIIISW